MRASDFTSSKYASASDFGPEPTTWIIHAVGTAVFKRDGGYDQEEKPTITLADAAGQATKPLVLNITRLRSLAKIFGDSMDTWPGRTVRIWTEVILFRGEETATIRISSAPAAVQQQQQRRSGGGRGGSASGTGSNDLDDKIPFISQSLCREPGIARKPTVL
jgi:hypothetical protein